MATGSDHDVFVPVAVTLVPISVQFVVLNEFRYATRYVLPAVLGQLIVTPLLLRASEARKPSPPVLFVDDDCPFVTVIETAGAVARLPAASRATAVNECVPLLRSVALVV